MAKRYERLQKRLQVEHAQARLNGAEIYYFEIPFSKKALPYRFKPDDPNGSLEDLGTITIKNVSKCDQWFCNVTFVLDKSPQRKLFLSREKSDIIAINLFSYKFELLGRRKVRKDGSGARNLILAIIKTINFPTGIKDIDMNILLQMELRDINKFCGANEYFNSICDQNNFWRLVLERDLRRKYGDPVRLPEYKIQEVNYKELVHVPHTLYLLIGLVYPQDKITPEYFIQKGGVLPIDQMILDDYMLKGKSIKIFEDLGYNLHANQDFLLVRAAEKGDFHLAEYLLEKGLDVNTLNGSPLIEAIRPIADTDPSDTFSFARGYLLNTRKPLIELLLENGAKITSDALALAVMTGYIELVQLLVDYGADLRMDNRKALHIAEQNHDTDMIQYIIARGG